MYKNVHLNSGAQNRKCIFLYTDIFCDRLHFLKLTLSKVNFQKKVKVTSVNNSIQSKFWTVRQVVSKVLHPGLNVLSLILIVSWCAYVATNNIYFMHQFDWLCNFLIENNMYCWWIEKKESPIYKIYDSSKNL